MNSVRSFSSRAGYILGMVLLAFLVFTLLAPVVQAGDVTVFPVNQDTQRLDASGSVSYQFVVYNNGTVPYLVQSAVAPSSIGGVTTSWDKDYATIEPGQSHTYSLTFSANRDVDNFNARFYVNFTSTDMSNPSLITKESYDVDLEVVSIFGVETGQNKVLNLFDNPMPEPFNTNTWAFVVSVLIWIGIGALFYFVVDPAVHLVTRRTDTELDDIILRILRKPLFLLIILIGSVNSLEILKLSGEMLTTVETIYHILLVCIGAWLAYKVYDEIVIYYAHRHAQSTENEMDDALIPIMEKLGMIFIPFVALMLIFSILGYDLTVMLASAGFLGIVIGYAAQSTLANFFAGFTMLVDRPFKVGDELLMDNGDFAEVTHIGMRSTELLDTTNNQMIVIPNDLISNNKIVNAVRPDQRLRITVVIGVAYGSDIELVKSLMLDAAKEIPNAIPDKKPVIRLSEFGDSAINLKIFIDIDDANNKWKAASDFRERLYQKFNDLGVEIPFPQRVVYIKDERGTERKN